MEPVLGQQQVEVGCFPPVDRQAASHVALGGELPHRVAVHQHFHHRGLFGIEMGGVTSWQLNRRKQAVVQGGGHQTLILLLDLGQQGGGVALKNALHPALRRATASALAGHLHQHPIAVPGVVELVIADVDVFATVFAQGKAEAFAGATQPCGDQFRVFAAGYAGLTDLQQAKAAEAVEADLKLLLFSFLANAQGFFQLCQRQGFLGGQLVEQVGDRELHLWEGWLD